MVQIEWAHRYVDSELAVCYQKEQPHSPWIVHMFYQEPEATLDLNAAKRDSVVVQVHPSASHDDIKALLSKYMKLPEKHFCPNRNVLRALEQIVAGNQERIFSSEALPKVTKEPRKHTVHHD